MISAAGVIDHEAQYGDDDYLCYADHRSDLSWLRALTLLEDSADNQLLITFHKTVSCTISSHSGPHWVWLTAGSCSLGGASASSPPHPPTNWFVENSASHSSQLSLAGDPWRVDILQVCMKIRIFESLYELFEKMHISSVS